MTDYIFDQHELNFNCFSDIYFIDDFHKKFKDLNIRGYWERNVASYQSERTINFKLLGKNKIHIEVLEIQFSLIMFIQSTW